MSLIALQTGGPVGATPAGATPVTDTTTTTPSGPTGATSTGRTHSGKDSSSAAGEIGALIGSVGGSIAGLMIGSLGGPLGAMAGTWVGGIIGAGAGQLIAEAAADALDDDDATVWYSLSPDEKRSLIQNLLWEVVLGFLPAGIAALVGRAPRVAEKATKLKDSILSVFTRKAPVLGGTNIAAAAANAIIDSTSLGAVTKALANLSERQGRKVWSQLAEEVKKARIKEVDRLDYKAFRDIPPGAQPDSITWKLPAYSKSLNFEKILKEVASSPEGLKALKNWEKSTTVKRLYYALGLKSILTTAESVSEAKNLGGLIAPVANTRSLAKFRAQGGLIAR